MARLKFGTSSLNGGIVFGPNLVTSIISAIASPDSGELITDSVTPNVIAKYPDPNIRGTLYDPLGVPIAGAEIRFTALDSIGFSIKGSTAQYTTDAFGHYDFYLAFGSYRIEAKYEDEYHDLGSVLVDRGTPLVISVTDLILYGSLVTPPILVDIAPDWALLFSEVQSQGEHREAQYQIREGDDYTSETKELWVASDAAMTDESLESNTRSTKMMTQIRTYEDDILNQAALLTNEGTTNNLRTYTSLEALEGADGSEEIKSTQVLEGTSSKIEDTKHVSVSGIEVTKEVTFQSTSIQETVVADESSLDHSIVTTIGGSTSERTNEYSPTHVNNAVTVPQPKAMQEDNSSLVEVIGNVTHTASINNHQEMVISVDELASALRQAGVTVYDKEAFQRLSIEGGKSTLTTQVDEHLIQDDAGNVLAEFDTISNKLTLNGRLEIQNAEDFQGPSGDTIDYLYQYSSDNGVTDAWHDTYDAQHPDRWRRQRKTINDIAVGSWEAGIYLNAKDGRDGDTYFNQFQYSTDDTSKALDSWHITYVSGDDWRRWRVIENGIPVGSGHEFYGPDSGWYEERMKGLDGPAGWVPDVQYQYSTNNLPPWHNDFITGDLYRRERVNWYASNDDFLNKDHPTSPSTPILAGTWTSGAKIAPEIGVDYGDKTATVIMYQRLNGDIAPADPSNIIYTFDTVTIDPQDNVLWTANIPEGLEDIWVAIGTAFGKGETDTIDDWVVEKQVANGFKTGVAWLYRVTDQNTILNATHLPTNPLTYTFATGKVSGTLDNDWSATIPDSLSSEGSKTWITHNTAVSPVANLVDTLDADDWEDPSVLVRNGQDGLNGADGDAGGYTSFVFFNKATAPALPENGSFDGSDEVFPDDTASGTKWSDDPSTPIAGEFTWVSKAKYAYNGTSWDNLGWSAPTQFSGDTGATGDHGSFDSFIFFNSEPAPSTPTGGSFNGTTETYPTNWSDSPSTPTHPEVTWMSKTTYSYVNDTWTATPIWSSPTQLSGDKGIDGIDGDQGRFFSYVYRNASTTPAAPTNGSFNGSVETMPTLPQPWTDDPVNAPEGETTWVSTAIYVAGQSGWEHSGWSDPARYSGVAGKDAGRFTSYIYSNGTTPPAVPTSGGVFDGTTFSALVPNGVWTDAAETAPAGELTWVTTAVYIYDDDTGTWSLPTWSTPAQFSGSKGDTGEVGDEGAFTSFVYRNAVTKPLTPLNGSFGAGGEVFPHIPSNVNDKWDDDPIDPPAGETTWMSTTKYTIVNDIWENSGWSSPARFSGLAGVNAGKYVSNVYKNAVSVPTGAALATGGSFIDGTETLPDTNWFDASQPRAANEFTWISTAVYLYNAGTGLWNHSGWSTPVQFSGDVGSDGDKGTFTAFAYKNSATAITVRPTGGDYVGLGPIVPPSVDWELEPTSPAFGSRTWVSSTTYTWDDPSNTWEAGTWSLPALFSGERGVDAGKYISHMYAAAVSAPTSITGGSFTGDPSTEVPPTSTGGTWFDSLPTPAAGELSWMITAVYTYDDSDNTWSHSGWSSPVRLTGEQGSAGVDAAGWYYIHSCPTTWFSNNETFNWASYGDDPHLVDLFQTELPNHTLVNGDICAVANSNIDPTHSDVGIYIASTNTFESVEATVNGNMIITGTLNADRIKANSITADQLAVEELITDTAQIGEAVIGEGNIDNGAITNLKIGNEIISNSYVPQLSGWKIDKNGSAELNDLKIYDPDGRLAFSSGYNYFVTSPDITTGVVLNKNDNLDDSFTYVDVNNSLTRDVPNYYNIERAGYGILETAAEYSADEIYFSAQCRIGQDNTGYNISNEVLPVRVGEVDEIEAKVYAGNGSRTYTLKVYELDTTLPTGVKYLSESYTNTETVLATRVITLDTVTTSTISTLNSTAYTPTATAKHFCVALTWPSGSGADYTFIYHMRIKGRRAQVGSTYIKDAAIDNAKIGEAAVDTLKIAENAVTATQLVEFVDSWTGWTTGWVAIGSFVINHGHSSDVLMVLDISAALKAAEDHECVTGSQLRVNIEGGTNYYSAVSDLANIDFSSGFGINNSRGNALHRIVRAISVSSGNHTVTVYARGYDVRGGAEGVSWSGATALAVAGKR